MVGRLLRPHALIAVFYVGLVSTIIMLANSGYRSTLFGFIDIIPYGDKLGHFVLMGILSLLVTFSLSPRVVRFGPLNLPLGLLLVLVATTLEEYSQVWFPARNFSLGDLACNVVGIIVGGILASLASRRRL